MSERASCMIDTVDSGTHYRVIGDAEDVSRRLARADQDDFVQFELCRRMGKAIFISPDKVIAVLDPA